MSIQEFDCNDCPLGGAALYGPTFEDSRAAIAHVRCGVRTFAPQRRIFREGEDTAEIYTIREGWAFRYRELSHGRRQILAFMIPGDTLPIEKIWLPKSPIPYSIKALTELTVCVFPLQALRDLISTSPKQLDAMETVGFRVVDANYSRIADLGRRSARGRIARLLLYLEGRLRERGLVSDDSFPFPLRQEHVADATGLTSVHVNRTLGVLKKERIAAVENQKVTIFDRTALLTTAEEF